MIGQLENKLANLESAKPTIFQMENRIARLEQQSHEARQEGQELEARLDDAQFTLRKCRHMRVLANAYPLTIKQIEAFKANPQTCASIDSLMQYANKEAEKIAIQDAYNIACTNIPTCENSGSICE
jgi:chromosome segregation ATPase